MYESVVSIAYFDSPKQFLQINTINEYSRTSGASIRRFVSSSIPTTLLSLACIPLLFSVFLISLCSLLILFLSSSSARVWSSWPNVSRLAQSAGSSHRISLRSSWFALPGFSKCLWNIWTYVRSKSRDDRSFRHGLICLDSFLRSTWSKIDLEEDPAHRHIDT